MFSVVEEQRNLALASIGELQAELSVLQDQYANHVRTLEMEIGRLNAENQRLKKAQEQKT